MASVKKSVLITGCTPGGIGSALAYAFHDQGFRVFATARSTTKLAPLAAKGIEVLELDVTDIDAISRAREEIERKSQGRLHILVNNAGVWLEKPAIEANISDIRSMFEVNVFGLMNMVQEFRPLLSATRGTIVNMSSILATMPYPFTSAYNASKAAVSQYSDTLRLELEPLGIRVVTVMTGQVASNLPVTPVLSENSIYKPLQAQLNERARTHKEKTMSPEVFAVALVKTVTSSTIPATLWKGTNSTLTWFVSNYAPRSLFNVLMRKLSGLDAGQAAISQQPLDK